MKVDLWRSEEMQLMQLMMPAETARDTVAALGQVGLLQFKDLSEDKSPLQRTFANQVKRTDELSRKMRFFTDQVEKSGVIPGARSGAIDALNMDELEAKLDHLEAELLELNSNSERLSRSHAELVELQLVLEKAGSFFDDAQFRASSSSAFDQRASQSEGSEIGAPLLKAEAQPEPKSVRLGFVAGMIAQEKLTPFERLLFRATRGNMFLKNSSVGSVLDPTTSEKQEKAVFVVFFAGDRARTKIMKICEAFGANRYPFPEEPQRQRQMNAEVTSRLRELHTTVDAGDRQRDSVIQVVASNLEQWTLQVKREKAVYHTLNKLSVDVTRKVLVAEAWCPVSGIQRVRTALQEATQQTAGAVGTVFQPLVTYESPPTYFETDKVNSSFQEIVHAYGIARYREVNPTVFTIVTFPFLFAVMFGDVGHGLLMLFFAVYLVTSEKALGKQQLNEIFEMAFGGRYVILLMSIFSIYTGLLYNEMFSVPTSIFGTGHWACPSDHSLTDRAAMMLDTKLCPAAFGDGLEVTSKTPYAFGVDPTWHGTRSELTYLNSLKMKMSIIMGVAQMDLGIAMSWFNQRYFRDSLSMWCEFVPQIIFLNGLFGYLCLLIIGKWISGSTADLYHVLIYMFLSPGDAGLTCNGDCVENRMFPGQGALQLVLLLLAVVAIPWMLVPKPYLLRKRHLKRQEQLANYGRVSPQDEDGENDEESGNMRLAAAHHEEEEEFDFSEIAVHQVWRMALTGSSLFQMIHTIEFVLGAVSNTASYLRLWALSLAHSQLSAVFYDRLLMGVGIQYNNAAILFIAFFVFICATLGVLMVMESLSAFLHALRLHWVEFQNKFYHGDGYLFTPLDFGLVDKEVL